MIKRIAITVHPKVPGKNWDDFRSMILDCYPTGHYIHMPGTEDRLTFVFYGRDEWYICSNIKDVIGEKGSFPASISTDVTMVTEAEWARIQDHEGLSGTFPALNQYPVE